MAIIYDNFTSNIAKYFHNFLYLFVYILLRFWQQYEEVLHLDING